MFSSVAQSSFLWGQEGSNLGGEHYTSGFFQDSNLIHQPFMYFQFCVSVDGGKQQADINIQRIRQVPSLFD